MSFTRRYPLILLVLIAILFPLRVQAQALRTDDLLTLIRDSTSHDYCSFALDKLCSHRIVMLADQGHGVALYYQTVIQILNHWVTACEGEGQIIIREDLPRSLFLALEDDSLHVAAVKKYFATGNLMDVVDPEFFMGYQFTTASLRFYADLRSLWLRIDSLNRGRSKDRLIHFDLIGPEKHIDLSDWSVERRERFFTYERDEYSSSKLIQLLDAQPAAKLLIFYGSAHLLFGEQQKPPEKPIGKGYYLAHYLEERFRNKGGVYRCGQIAIPVSRWLDPAFEKVTHPFALDHSCWESVSIDPSASFPQFDGGIYHVAQPVQSKHISKILSENLIDLILKKIQTYNTFNNEFGRTFLKLWFVYLSNFTDKDYSPVNPGDSSAVVQAINELKQWRQSTKFNVVQQIDDLTIWKRSIVRIASSKDPQATRYQMFLSTFVGFKVWHQYGASPQVRADATSKAIERYRTSITTENLIGSLWLGTTAEKEQALSILWRETGQRFSKPEDWEQWLAQRDL